MTDDLWFKNKGAALVWYAEQGGRRGKSSFYAAVPVDGKRVSRLAVSEMLRKERVASPAATDLASRKELADTEKAESDARTAKVRADEAERALDKKWILRSSADESECIATARTRDACIYHIGKNLPALIQAVGGDVGRISEGQAIIDSAFVSACNEIADLGEEEWEIEDLEGEE